MKEANSTRLHILAATCNGIAAIVIATLALVNQPRTVALDRASPAASNDQMARLVANMDALNKALVRLEGRLDELQDLVALTPNTRKVLPADRREPVTPTADTALEETEVVDESSPYWAGILDEGIVRVLIERGLTPYDSGVAEHVAKAGDALRTAEREYTAAFDQLNSELRSNLITFEENRDLLRPHAMLRNSRREEIIGRLGTGLDGLPGRAEEE